MRQAHVSGVPQHMFHKSSRVSGLGLASAGDPVRTVGGVLALGSSCSGRCPRLGHSGSQPREVRD